MCWVSDLTNGRKHSVSEASLAPRLSPTTPQLFPGLQAERHLPCSMLYVSLQWCHTELSEENIWPLNVLFIKIICPRESKLAKSDEINEHKSGNSERAKMGIFRKWSNPKHCLSLLRLSTSRGCVTPEESKKQRAKERPMTDCWLIASHVNQNEESVQNPAPALQKGP